MFNILGVTNVLTFVQVFKRVIRKICIPIALILCIFNNNSMTMQISVNIFVLYYLVVAIAMKKMQWTVHFKSFENEFILRTLLFHLGTYVGLWPFNCYINVENSNLKLSSAPMSSIIILETVHRTMLYIFLINCCWILVLILFKLTSKRTSKSAFRERNLPVTDGFSSQKANNAENVSISWRHNDTADHRKSQTCKR